MYTLKRKRIKVLLNNIISLIISVTMITQLSGITSYADYYLYSDDYGVFLEALGKRESSNRYILQNRYGYMGRWQLGMSALQDIGFVDNDNNFTSLANSFGAFNKTTFLLSEQAQDYAIYRYHRMTWSYLVNQGLDAYVGSVVQVTEPTEVVVTTISEDREEVVTTINEDGVEETVTTINEDGIEEVVTTIIEGGEEVVVTTINDDGEEEVVTTIEDVVVEEIPITVSNLIAGSHLMGTGNMKKYLQGDTTLKDGNGTELNEYMRLFGDYDITDTIIYGASFEELCNCKNLYVGEYVVESTAPNQDGVDVYSGHGIYNDIIGHIENGETIHIIKSDGVWGHVQLSDGSDGCILLSSLKTFQHVTRIGDIDNDGIVGFLELLQIKNYIFTQQKPYILSSVDFYHDDDLDISD
ncbi:MAG: hypothetical protein LUG94_08680, partial [Ruminococcus sp.]|nr:hypothetical protein [Ruminococcus sp.]